MRTTLSALSFIALLAIGGTRSTSNAASLQESVTLTGCVERDAAARAEVYKLIVKAEGGSKIYRLTASGGVDIAAALGRTVEITGSVGAKDVVTVQKMRTVSEHCS